MFLMKRKRNVTREIYVFEILGDSIKYLKLLVFVYLGSRGLSNGGHLFDSLSKALGKSLYQKEILCLLGVQKVHRFRFFYQSKV